MTVAELPVEPLSFPGPQPTRTTAAGAAPRLVGAAWPPLAPTCAVAFACLSPERRWCGSGRASQAERQPAPKRRSRERRSCRQFRRRPSAQVCGRRAANGRPTAANGGVSRPRRRHRRGCRGRRHFKRNHRPRRPWRVVRTERKRGRAAYCEALRRACSARVAESATRPSGRLWEYCT